MLIDSHCHLDRIDLAPFNNDLSEALEFAANDGVSGCLCVAIDNENQSRVIEIAEAYSSVWASIGVHPLYTEGQSLEAERVYAHAKHPRVVAIGETGLDYFYAKETKLQQLALFEAHLEAAANTQLPVIVHTREAREDTLKLLGRYADRLNGGVLHCFTESLAMAEAAMEMGFYVSFSGIVTFKNARELQQVALKIPLDRLLVETDSPYLTPVPLRGKPNSPRNVVEVARFLAQLREEPFQTICQSTTQNFFRLFSKASLSGDMA